MSSFFLAPPTTLLNRSELSQVDAQLSSHQLPSCTSDPQVGLTPAGHPSPPGVVKRSFVSRDCGKFLPSSLLQDPPFLIGSVFDCQQMEGELSKTKGFESELFL
jgi:hypothetical protein